MKKEKATTPQLKARSSSHKIQWLNLPGYKGETWNPVIGCSKVSDGCKNCYAEKMAVRLANIENTAYYRRVTCRNAHSMPFGWNGETHFVPSQLNKPALWKSPRVIFVCSMGDLFHETVSALELQLVFDIIAKNRRHIFIILTKRPENILPKLLQTGWLNPLPPNVWLGVTAENQEQANLRIPCLLEIPAAVRFVSIEPMLGPVNISEYWQECGNGAYELWINGLDWVICGGESGHQARPMHPDWVRLLRDQCKAAQVPFFFKQWGEWAAFSKEESEYIRLTRGNMFEEGCIAFTKVGKHKSGNLLDGVKYEEYPNY